MNENHENEVVKAILRHPSLLASGFRLVMIFSIGAAIAFAGLAVYYFKDEYFGRIFMAVGMVICLIPIAFVVFSKASESTIVVKPESPVAPIPTKLPEEPRKPVAPPAPPPVPAYFIVDDVVVSYDLIGSFSGDQASLIIRDVNEKIREIINANPGADVRRLETALGIRNLMVQRKSPLPAPDVPKASEPLTDDVDLGDIE